MIVSDTNNLALHKQFFREFNTRSEYTHKPVFSKSSHPWALYNNVLDSKFWFMNANNPLSCRGISFSFLLLSNIGKWRDSKKMPAARIIPATFPVIPFSPDSSIILEAGPCRPSSFFIKEYNDALKKISPFSVFVNPWHDDPEKIYRFDFNDEKIKFYNNIIKYRNCRKFPHFPNISGKDLYALWLKGLPLEAIHWYASEASYYPSRSRFHSLYPVSPLRSDHPLPLPPSL